MTGPPLAGGGGGNAALALRPSGSEHPLLLLATADHGRTGARFRPDGQWWGDADSAYIILYRNDIRVCSACRPHELPPSEIMK